MAFTSEQERGEKVRKTCFVAVANNKYPEFHSAREETGFTSPRQEAIGKQLAFDSMEGEAQHV